MWRPKTFGTICGWTLVLFALTAALSPALLEAGVLGEQCSKFAPGAFHCKLPASLLFGFGSLPHYFFGSLAGPFVYDRSRDTDGYGLLGLIVMTPIAYAWLAVALNYWGWQIRARLSRS